MDLVIFRPPYELTDRSDSALIKWANDILAKCSSSLRFYETTVDILRKFIEDSYLDVIFQKNKHIWLDASLIQPQGAYYGLDSRGNPLPGMLDFYGDGSLNGILENIGSVKSSITDTFVHAFSESILGKVTQCLTSVVFFSIPSSTTKSRFQLVTVLDVDTIPEWIPEIENIPVKQYLNRQRRELKKNISEIKKCIRKHVDYIYLGVTLFIEKEIGHLKENGIHETNVVLNLTDKNNPLIISFEPSLSESEKLHNRYETIYKNAFVGFATKHLQLHNIHYITLSEEACPRFSIQGANDTCALWSLYLFYVYILNGNRKYIYSRFEKVDVNTRHKVLSQFVYFAYTFCKNNSIQIGEYIDDKYAIGIFKYLGDVWK